MSPFWTSHQIGSRFKIHKAKCFVSPAYLLASAMRLLPLAPLYSQRFTTTFRNKICFLLCKLRPTVESPTLFNAFLDRDNLGAYQFVKRLFCSACASPTKHATEELLFKARVHSATVLSMWGADFYLTRMYPHHDVTFWRPQAHAVGARQERTVSVIVNGQYRKIYPRTSIQLQNNIKCQSLKTRKESGLAQSGVTKTAIIRQKNKSRWIETIDDQCKPNTEDFP